MPESRNHLAEEPSKLQENQQQQNEDEEMEYEPTLDLMEVEKPKNHKSKKVTWVDRVHEHEGIPDRLPAIIPIIVGSDSKFKSPNDLRAFFGLRDILSVSQAKEVRTDWGGPVQYNPTPTNPMDDPTLRSYTVCEINFAQYENLRSFTEGKWVDVWLNGKLRFAWLPHPGMKQ